MDLDNRAKKSAESWGADFFGVADLLSARDTLLAQGGVDVSEYPRAISMGIILLNSIVNQLPQRAARAVALGYRHHLYNVTDRRLDLVASRVGSILQREGYNALPIPASEQYEEHLCADFSHKLAAHLAGLGWIGKNCLLITPEVGPRVRWVTVLTDAPLIATGQPVEQRCGSCTQCKEICPVQALVGQPFHESEPREARFDAHRCDRYFDQMRKDGTVAVCGLCLYVCPYGRRVTP